MEHQRSSFSRRALRALAGTAICTMLWVPAAQAQDGSLKRVQDLITAGRFTEAKSVLAQWETQAQQRTDVGTEDLALGRFLNGVLESDAKAAEDVYVEVVLSYPSSRVAPQALLRLGQGLIAAGDNRRALGYLERLRSDYPGTAERETGLLWLARAQTATGSAAAACTTARGALEDTDNANLRSLLEIEQERACGGRPAPDTRREPGLGAPPAADPEPGTATPPVQRPNTQPPPQPQQQQQQPATQQPRPAPTTQSPPATRTDAPARGDYSVQVGAFRELRSAEVIASQMREKGFDARIVQVDDSPLHRIRFGYYASSAEAAVVGQRIRNAGFASIIVSDVKREVVK